MISLAADCLLALDLYLDSDLGRKDPIHFRRMGRIKKCGSGAYLCDHIRQADQGQIRRCYYPRRNPYISLGSPAKETRKVAYLGQEPGLYHRTSIFTKSCSFIYHLPYKDKARLALLFIF